MHDTLVQSSVKLHPLLFQEMGEKLREVRLDENGEPTSIGSSQPLSIDLSSDFIGLN